MLCTSNKLSVCDSILSLTTPIWFYGLYRLIENRSFIGRCVSNGFFSVYAWCLGVKRYNRFDEEVFEPLDKEYGLKEIRTYDMTIIAEGYYNEDVITGPGSVYYSKKDQLIYTKGIHKNNQLNGPGRYIIRKETEHGRMTGLYLGTFRNNTLHNKGVYETEYVKIRGIFHKGYLLSGTITIKHFDPCFMDQSYCNKTTIQGTFTGDVCLSPQTTVLPYFTLQGEGLMETRQFTQSTKEKGWFQDGLLHGQGSRTVVRMVVHHQLSNYVNQSLMDVLFGLTRPVVYVISGTFKAGNPVEDLVIKNNGIDYKRTPDGHQLNYPTGECLELDQNLDKFKLIFQSQDTVHGVIKDKELIERNFLLNNDFENELNPNGLRYVLLSTMKGARYTRNQPFIKMNNLEVLFWLHGTNIELLEKICAHGLDMGLDGQRFMSNDFVTELGLVPEVLSKLIDPMEEKQEETEMDTKKHESTEDEDSFFLLSSTEHSES